jgi:hypothetical protein
MIKEIRSQAEWDSLPKAFDQFTEVRIVSPADEWIRISTVPVNAHVVAWGSSHVVAWESSHVVARESSHVVAWGSSHVVARESSHVVAWESSHVVARESSHVVAWGSSHVVARESSHVVARESSHVVAWESSHVVAWESSHVEAWESSHVVAWESSHVVAWGSVSVHCLSVSVHIEMFGFAVAMLMAKAKQCLKKSKTCTVIEPKLAKGVKGFCERDGVEQSRGSVILFKRVSKDFKTQEGTSNETLWTVGSTLEHPDWNPTARECGPGKFHACSRAYFCDQFRSEPGDRYVAIKIAVDDLHVWDENPEYPHKVAFRKGKVLFECDSFGKQK